MDDRRQPKPARQDVAASGDEPTEGRPSGVPAESRSGSEGRPSVVKEARPGSVPPAEQMPTESAAERGETPETEHEPGGDL